MRLKFYKRSAEIFVSRIDPEVFSASGSRVRFSAACRLRLRSSFSVGAWRNGEGTMFEIVESP